MTPFSVFLIRFGGAMTTMTTYWYNMPMMMYLSRYVCIYLCMVSMAV